MAKRKAKITTRGAESAAANPPKGSGSSLSETEKETGLSPESRAANAGTTSVPIADSAQLAASSSASGSTSDADPSAALGVMEDALKKTEGEAPVGEPSHETLPSGADGGAPNAEIGDLFPNVSSKRPGIGKRGWPEGRPRTPGAEQDEWDRANNYVPSSRRPRDYAAEHARRKRGEEGSEALPSFAGSGPVGDADTLARLQKVERENARLNSQINDYRARLDPQVHKMVKASISGLVMLAGSFFARMYGDHCAVEQGEADNAGEHCGNALIPFMGDLAKYMPWITAAGSLAAIAMPRLAYEERIKKGEVPRLKNGVPVAS